MEKDKKTKIKTVKKVTKKQKKIEIKPTTKLVIMKKCTDCIKNCKIESLSHAELIACPDYKSTSKS